MPQKAGRTDSGLPPIPLPAAPQERRTGKTDSRTAVVTPPAHRFFLVRWLISAFKAIGKALHLYNPRPIEPVTTYMPPQSQPRTASKTEASPASVNMRNMNESDRCYRDMAELFLFNQAITQNGTAKPLSDQDAEKVLHEMENLKAIKHFPPRYSDAVANLLPHTTPNLGVTMRQIKAHFGKMADIETTLSQSSSGIMQLTNQLRMQREQLLSKLMDYRQTASQLQDFTGRIEFYNKRHLPQISLLFQRFTDRSKEALDRIHKLRNDVHQLQDLFNQSKGVITNQGLKDEYQTEINEVQNWVDDLVLNAEACYDLTQGRTKKAARIKRGD